MFKLDQSQSYSWPVAVEFPISGGKFEKQTFDAEFKRLPQSRMKEVLSTETETIPDLEFSKEVLLGWKGIQAADGSEIPFSESARDQLLDVPLVARAVVMAFLNSATGGKIKN